MGGRWQRAGSGMACKERYKAAVGEVVAAGLVILVPLVMWLGFADNVGVPKVLVLQALILALAASVMADPGRRARAASSPLAIPASLLAASALASCLLSGAAASSWQGEPGSWMGASRTGSLALACLLVAAGLTPRGVRKAVAGTLVAAAALLVYAFIQAMGLDPFPWNPALKSGYWLFATLGNPVHLGGFLACALWLTFAGGGASPGRPSTRLLLWTFRALLVAGVAATQARSALLAVAGGGVVVLLQGRGGALGRLRRLVPVLVLASAAVALAALAGDRIGSLTRVTGARPHIWEAAGRLLADRPWFGIGPDMLYSRFLSAARYGYFTAEPPGVSGDTIFPRLPASAHNEPVNLAAAQGVVGAGLYAWLLLVVLRAGGRSPLLPGLASCWLVHLANPASPATAALFWVLAGAVTVGGASPLPGPGAREAGTGTPRAARGLVLVFLAVSFLTVSLVTVLRMSVTQAHLREAGRLAHFGRWPELRAHLDRWSARAAGTGPRAAFEDAVLYRRLASAGEDAAANSRRAVELLSAARVADPYNIFHLSALADLALAEGKRNRDAGLLRRAEGLLREALRRGPAALSLYDDLADVLDAQGRGGEAVRMREERRRRDPEGLFARQGSK